MKLDVRPLIPLERHGLVFKIFGALASGKAFGLVNDRKPKPLEERLAVRRLRIGRV